MKSKPVAEQLLWSELFVSCKDKQNGTFNVLFICYFRLSWGGGWFAGM